MDYSLILLGVSGTLTFSVSALLIKKVLKFVEADPEVALRKLFLREEALKGFKILGITYLILSLPLIAEILSDIISQPAIGAASRYLMSFIVTGILYFNIQLYRSTKPYED